LIVRLRVHGSRRLEGELQTKGKRKRIDAGILLARLRV
jgi:hypothetical protein